MPIGINILCTIRRILDSKHNEYINNLHPTQHTPMPVFTLAWLGNWTLNPKTKQPLPTHSELSFSVLTTFYVQLMDPRLNCNW